jgi:hypothetical protein
MVAPGCTLVAEAVTLMSAAAAGVGVGVGVGVEVGGGVALPVLPVLGVGVGVGVAGVVALITLPLPVGVGVGVGVAEVAAAVGVGELVAATVAVELAGPEAAGDADADGDVAASAVPLTPLVMTNRPVARPTVTGRECAERMRTPCLSWLSRLKNILSGSVCHPGGSRCFLVTTAPIRHQNRHSTPPLRHTSPRIAAASSQASRPHVALGPVVHQA